ncbi:hypothetical protein TRIATDRAFT_297317 [Trichoderma atroviride IMI 206040]|uniref:Uncharacterized protein n=1 Tax=Hypocrea atroviridis (strain ATCC 20476 / IMI 206040) TaxID=452589 RepID=G9NH47_HYPAI|nr:uncharacterized protein TRIATDRAFT_297317 [Trichoderma atroviride IMI 206040]EHK49943.1 hypothetical protein TRIATDRAFT_297317 [Trichoderma atroviride IMI 206040]
MSCGGTYASVQYSVQHSGIRKRKGRIFAAPTPPVRIDRHDRAEARLMGRRRWRKLFGTDGGMAEGNRGRRGEQSPERRANKNQSSRVTRTKNSLWSLDRGERRVLRLLGGDSMTFFFSLGKGESFFFWGCLKQGQGVLAAVWNRVSSFVGPLVFVSAGRQSQRCGEDPLPVFISACCNAFAAKYVL